MKLTLGYAALAVHLLSDGFSWRDVFLYLAVGLVAEGLAGRSRDHAKALEERVGPHGATASAGTEGQLGPR